MLKSYDATISTANTNTTLFTTASGHETLVIGIRVYGGTNGATVTLTKNDGTNDVFTEKYTVGAGDVLSVDSRSAFPAGYLLKAQADATGVQIDVCADDVETA